MSIPSLSPSTKAPSTDTEKKAWKAAQDFEAIFMRQIFQSMRKSSAILSETDQETPDSTTQMVDMAWDGMADQVAHQGGMGLAKVLYSQFLKNPSALDPANDSAHAAKVSSAYAPSRTTNLDQAIQQASTDTGLDASLIRAVIHTESRGRTDAVSSKGAIGPMQLMPATAKELGVDPRDPVQNILGGSRYLARMRERFGSDELALAAYNAGPGAVERHGGIPPYAETRSYVKSVMAKRDQLEGGAS
ncbi:MAG TPA: transglycosylase SLT domain-containing protein [Fibrobacteria bacterium]|nr:transglycosylase SLT domain-containing protein [Fibrobacteria bacterium]HOX52302.1 transglycosylase SLT domain-containing protein [Fibrobacteria bacterium]